VRYPARGMTTGAGEAVVRDHAEPRCSVTDNHWVKESNMTVNIMTERPPSGSQI
jgi:hypothetical protein